MTAFTRLTLVGSTRRADVVVPSDEGLAALLPRLLEIVEETPRLQPATTALVRATGEQVDLARDAASQDLADGEVLRVVRAAAAPPPPEVADVTDVASEDLAARTDRWDVDVRQRAAATVVGAATAAAGAVLVPLLPGAVLAGAAAGLALVVAAVAVAVGRSGRRHPARVLTATGLGAAVVVGLALAQRDVTGPAAAALTGLAVAWLALAAGAGWARRDRGALAGSAVGVGLTALHLALGAALPGDVAGSVVTVVALVVLGLLPGYAMTAAGLTAIDDAVLDGALPSRDQVRRSLDDAYRGLSWSAAAVAVTLTGTCAGLLTSDDAGAVTLGALAVAVTALRSRSLPLAVQGVALWAAVTVPLLVGVVLAWGPRSPLATAGAVVAAVLVLAVAASLRPSGQQRARWRRTGDLVELLLVISVLPVLLGVLGVYGLLLEVF